MLCFLRRNQAFGRRGLSELHAESSGCLNERKQDEHAKEADQVHDAMAFWAMAQRRGREQRSKKSCPSLGKDSSRNQFKSNKDPYTWKESKSNKETKSRKESELREVS
jgi:hypothetical protein